MAESRKMPRRDEVDPMFDGHLERAFPELTADEKIDWLWQTMQLFQLGQTTRAAYFTTTRS